MKLCSDSIFGHEESLDYGYMNHLTEGAMGIAKEVHHIFPKSEFPELASYFGNLILLTCCQHRLKAHPNSNCHMVDKEHQLIGLMAKSHSVENYINKHEEEFY